VDAWFRSLRDGTVCFYGAEEAAHKLLPKDPANRPFKYPFYLPRHGGHLVALTQILLHENEAKLPRYSVGWPLLNEICEKRVSRAVQLSIDERVQHAYLAETGAAS
jgi:hypothetical protein